MGDGRPHIPRVRLYKVAALLVCWVVILCILVLKLYGSSPSSLRTEAPTKPAIKSNSIKQPVDTEVVVDTQEKLSTSKTSPKAEMLMRLEEEGDSDGERLLAWLRKNGATISTDIYVGNQKEHGVFSGTHVEEGTLLAHLPERVLLTEANAAKWSPLACAVNKAVKDNGASMSGNTKSELWEKARLTISAYLLDRIYRRSDGNSGEHSQCAVVIDAASVNREHCFFDPYIKILPNASSLIDFPIFSARNSGTCANFLHGSFVQRRTGVLYKLWHTQYDALCTQVPAMNSYTFEEFVSTRTLIASRAFVLHVGGRDVPVMVPLVDLMNMDVNNIKGRAPVEWFSFNKPGQTGVIIKSAARLPADQEWHISYGITPSGSLENYISYGFFVEGWVASQGALRELRWIMGAPAWESMDQTILAVWPALWTLDNLPPDFYALLGFAVNKTRSKTPSKPGEKSLALGDLNHEDNAVRFVQQRTQQAIDYYKSTVRHMVLLKKTETSNDCSRYRLIIQSTWQAIEDAAEKTLQERTPEKHRREGSGSMFKSLANHLFKAT